MWRSIYREEQVRSDGTLKTSFFRDKNGLSCDIAVLTTRERARLGLRGTWPPTAGLAEFKLRDVRQVRPAADVEHKPLKVDRVTGKVIDHYSHAQFTAHLLTSEAQELIKRSVIRVPFRG